MIAKNNNYDPLQEARDERPGYWFHSDWTPDGIANGKQQSEIFHYLL
jgi:hypothetical protein